MDRLARNAYMRGWHARNADRVHEQERERRKRPITQDDIEVAAPRFWRQVVKSDGCWIWTGVVIYSGYGRFAIRGRFLAAHRYALLLSGAEIPDGMTVDHLCGVRACVRPDHLEAVTNAENLKRSWQRRPPCLSCGERPAWRHGLCGRCTSAVAA